MTAQGATATRNARTRRRPLLSGLVLGLVSFLLASVLEAMRIEAVRDSSGAALLLAPLLLVALVVGFGFALLRWTEERGRMTALAAHLILALLGAGVGDLRFGAMDAELAFPSVLVRGSSSFAVASLIGVAIVTLLVARDTQPEADPRQVEAHTAG